MLPTIILASLAALGLASAAPAGGQHRPGLDENWLAFREQAERLHFQVQSDPHFAGFIIMNARQPYAIVRFTGDSASRLRRYTADPRFRPMTADVTLAELEALKDRTGEALHRLGLRCFIVDADEQLGRVTAKVVQIEEAERAIAEGRLDVSPRVQILPLSGCPEFR